MPDGWMTSYQRNVNAERLARQAPDVQRTAKEILEQLKSIEKLLYWSINPEDELAEWGASMIEHAHALVDLGHAWRAVLKDNPPPSEDEEDQVDYPDISAPGA